MQQLAKPVDQRKLRGIAQGRRTRKRADPNVKADNRADPR